MLFRSVNPFGSLDGVSLEDQGPGVQPGNLTVNGWAIDPDTVDPIDVHVYLDGQLKKAVTADLARLDVWIAYPAFGSSHGYSAGIDSVPPGTHTVCTYGINQGQGGNTLLGCKAVTVG